MTADPFTSVSQAIRRKGVTSVSFAVFGVLLLRRGLSIEAVYERTLALAPVSPRHKSLVEAFVQHRTLALNKAKFDRVATRGQPGFAIDAVYDRFAIHALDLPVSLRPALVEAELQAEQELCLVNPQIRVLYDEARATGKRVGLVTDSHWSAAQLAKLLATVAPEMTFDFLYSSADPEAAGGVFRAYLQAEDLKPTAALHIGADEDTMVVSRSGVKAIDYALPNDPMESFHEREDTIARMVAMGDPQFSWRQDGGLRRLRGLTLAQMGASLHAPQQLVGAAVLGPTMLGFHRYIEQKVAQLSGPGRKVKVAFLARDAYLPMRVWQALGGVGDATYAEVNRRIAMIAASEGKGGFDTLRNLFSGMAYVRKESIEQFFKIKLSPKARKFFKDHDNLVSGSEFCAELPKLISRKTIKTLSDNLRSALMDYLDGKFGRLDEVTDLVLVDIGYTGNIQRGLRRVFDVEGLSVRLHGLYLMPHGESFANLPEGDTVCGYFDDTVMSPAAKRAVMRDAPLIEQFCCAPVGSTRGYVDGKEIREDEVRTPADIAFSLEMQDECIRFVDVFRQLSRRFGLDPLADLNNFRSWSAAILGRMILLPTGLECQTFGPLLHDVSLGSRGLIATITTIDIENLMGTLPFPAVCSITHPPVWLGGSLTSHSAAAGLAYAVTGLGLGTNAVLNDIPVGQMEAMILKGEQCIPVPVTCVLTPFSDVRLRIPVLGRDTDCLVALPLRAQIQRGVIRSVILQTGADIGEATTTRWGTRQGVEELQAIRAVLDGSYYRAIEPDAFLLFKVPASESPMNLLTVLITPLFG
jgi:FMN phosphatase YigB (HAD superfamily)